MSWKVIGLASETFLGNETHVAAGALFPLGAKALFSKSKKAPFIGAALIVGIGILKEVFVDPYIEGQQLGGESIADVGYYALGAVSALYALEAAGQL